MPDAAQPSPETPPQHGISLTELSEAFARAMGVPSGPPREPDEPGQEAGSFGGHDVVDATAPVATGPSDDLGEDRREPELEPESSDDACPICPRTILEAMLFVGDRENEPLSSQRAADLMRGVAPGEIPDLVAELNRRYVETGCPYKIVSEGAGYQFVLRPEFHALQNKFYGHIRMARLSQAALEVLSIAAYRQPITSEEVSNLRGTPSGHLLAQLVRRRLLRIERKPEARRIAFYRTTDRFLRLFDLETLDDLPESEDLEKR
jgi:segregation and condensation protein B